MKGSCKLISNGKDTDICNDPWVIHGGNFYPYPLNGRPKGLEKVANLLTDDGNWDIPKLNFLFDRETTNSGCGRRNQMGVSLQNLPT
uniref:Uncharacterized protein n=1 Tax=Cannabis sativa TaxID=3483 RepID=A0A803QBU5_CANSA